MKLPRLNKEVLCVHRIIVRPIARKCALTPHYAKKKQAYTSSGTFAFIVTIRMKGSYIWGRNDTIVNMAKQPAHSRRDGNNSSPRKRRSSNGSILSNSARSQSGSLGNGLGNARDNIIGNVGFSALGSTGKHAPKTADAPTVRSRVSTTRGTQIGHGSFGMGKPGKGAASESFLERGKLLFSRRSFLYGAIGVGAAAAVGGGAAIYFATQNGDPDLEYLEVPTSSVTPLNDLTLVEDPSTRLAFYGSVDLPLGSLLWCNSDEVAACLIPTATGNPLTQIALLMLGSATYTVVLNEAVGSAEGFEIYDVRATANGLIWTEANILDGVWRIYTARIATGTGTLGTPQLADEGDSHYETPSIAAVKSYGLWQKQTTLANASTSDAPQTEIRRVSFGKTESDLLFSSARRMDTPLYAAEDSVVVTPRSPLARSYTSIVKIDVESGSITDALTLPASMRPFEVGCGKTGLMFSFENIYNYGDGIANLGTYVPAKRVPSTVIAWKSDADVAAQEAAAQSESSGSSSQASEDARSLPYDNTANYSAASWFRFSRTPTAAPAFCGKYLIVKSTYSVCGIDLAAGEYFALDVDNGADKYGEYIASSGSHNMLVTYTSIDYAPVNSAPQKMCRVKIWQPVNQALD